MTLRDESGQGRSREDREIVVEKMAVRKEINERRELRDKGDKKKHAGKIEERVVP